MPRVPDALDSATVLPAVDVIAPYPLMATACGDEVEVWRAYYRATLGQGGR
jgi:hypothetical protein